MVTVRAHLLQKKHYTSVSILSQENHGRNESPANFQEFGAVVSWPFSAHAPSIFLVECQIFLKKRSMDGWVPIVKAACIYLPRNEIFVFFLFSVKIVIALAVEKMWRAAPPVKKAAFLPVKPTADIKSTVRVCVCVCEI